MTIREKIVLSLFEVGDTKMLYEIAAFIAELKQKNKDNPLLPKVSPRPHSKERFYKAFGAWEGEAQAEDLIRDIKNSRLFNRQIESL